MKKFPQKNKCCFALERRTNAIMRSGNEKSKQIVRLMCSFSFYFCTEQKSKTQWSSQSKSQNYVHKNGELFNGNGKKLEHTPPAC